MPSIIRSTPFSLDDGGAIVKTILGILLLGILCSMVHLVYFPSPSELSKAEVNIDFGDSGDTITACATIRVEAPVGEQDVAAPSSFLPPSLLPDVSLLDTSLPDASFQVPSFSSPSLPKCCQVRNPDYSWLEHMVEVICKFREDAWRMMVKALLTIRDFLKQMLSLVCDFLALLLTYITSLIQYVDCNTSSNPWDGCNSKLLRDVLDIVDAKDKIVLSWIPDESTNTTTTGLSLMSRILISIATMLGFLIIIVLCIFFENSPGKEKIVQKLSHEVIKPQKKTTQPDHTLFQESDEESEEPTEPKKAEEKKKPRRRPIIRKRKPKKKETRKESESSEDEKIPPQHGPSKKREAVVDDKKLTKPKEEFDHILVKKEPETTIIIEENIFKDEEDDEEKRTVEAILEIQKLPSGNPEEEDKFNYDLTIDVDPDQKDHMTVDVHGHVDGGDMDVFTHVTTEGEGKADVHAEIHHGDDEDQDSVEMSVSDTSDSSSDQMHLRATQNRKKKSKLSRKMKKSSKTGKKS